MMIYFFCMLPQGCVKEKGNGGIGINFLCRENPLFFSEHPTLHTKKNESSTHKLFR